MQTYIIDGYRIAARSLTQAKLAAEYLRRSGAAPDITARHHSICRCETCRMAEVRS